MSNQVRGAFNRQAERLYERGVAAARGGQRTVAAGLLRQSVKLNPQHEQGWLWLAGVLDDPGDVAFCLRAVLGINPENERARKGLAQIGAQLGDEVSSKPTPAATAIPLREAAPAAAATAWWMDWRDGRIAWRRTVRLIWLIPLLLLSTTLGIRAIILMRPLPDLAAYRQTPVAEIATPRPTLVAPTPEPAPTTVAGAGEEVATHLEEVSHYFGAVRLERERLQQAIESYRKATEQSRTTLERVAAARALHGEVERSRQALENIEPPRDVMAAHKTYVDGLSLEAQALQDLLTFFTDDDLSAANRAAVRLQDARAHIAAAKAGWDAARLVAGGSTFPSAADGKLGR